MMSQNLLNTLVILALLIAGCRPQTSPPKKLPFDNIRLGMSSEEAKRLIGREGKEYAHDKLPFGPPPRGIYEKIPADTKWLVWWDEKGPVKRPVLALGVADGRVIFKDVSYEENGEAKGEYSVLPEYQ